jgi:hypothetical protein
MKLYRDGEEIADAECVSERWLGLPSLDRFTPLDWHKEFVLSVNRPATGRMGPQKWELGIEEERLEVEMVKPSLQAHDLEVVVRFKKKG